MIVNGQDYSMKFIALLSLECCINLNQGIDLSEIFIENEVVMKAFEEFVMNEYKLIDR